MTPDHYAIVYTEESRRIFVIISEVYGDFVLTKECSGRNCGCIGCSLFAAEYVNSEGLARPVIEVEHPETVGDNLTAYAFSIGGEQFLLQLNVDQHKSYRGTINKSILDEIFWFPEAMLIIKAEGDGTFTHRYLSPTVDMRVISRGCRAKNCPCVGCRIVDMWYTPGDGSLRPAVDFSVARATKENELILPILNGEEIISKLLTRDQSVRHEFSPSIFGSPLEKMFYELAFLDIHIFPQHPVGRYRLDFAIPDKRIAIELDGHEYHKTKYQRTHDAKRDRWLYAQGWHVLRFTGTEIHRNLDKCIDEICNIIGVERLSAAKS